MKTVIDFDENADRAQMKSVIAFALKSMIAYREIPHLVEPRGFLNAVEPEQDVKAPAADPTICRKCARWAIPCIHARNRRARGSHLTTNRVIYFDECFRRN
jgi:hypothetical protein